MRYWIGLGSNLGDPAAHVKTALTELSSQPGISLRRVSRMYRTAPWGHRDQPDFVNAVVALDSPQEPMVMLGRLQDIEGRMGRVRSGRRWGPRLIDLDVLLAGDLILHLERLVVPHPRMHRRRFVLMPMAEIDPGLVIPARGRVQHLLLGLPESGVSVVDTD